MEQGCFTCSAGKAATSVATHSVDFEYDHCVDLCSSSDTQAIAPAAWDTIRDATLFAGDALDTACGQIIQSAMTPLAEAGRIPVADLASFAEHLVLDERTNTCFAYDPRDERRRRLQEVYTRESCGQMNCFDCGFTAGACIYNKELNRCQLASKDVKVPVLR